MAGLKSFLIFNDLSQLEVARYLDISKGQMSKLVSGGAKLRLEQYEKLLHNDKGWNTEFLTDPIWDRLESGAITREDAGRLEENGKEKKNEESGDILMLRFEIDMLRQQLEKVEKQNREYWEMIKGLTAKQA